MDNWIKEMSLEEAKQILEDAIRDFDALHASTECLSTEFKETMYLRWELLDLLSEYFGEEDMRLLKAVFLFMKYPRRKVHVGKACILVLNEMLGELGGENE